MSLTLYVDQGNYLAFKILIAAEYNGINIQIPPFKKGETKVASPLGKYPAMKTSHGMLFESNAIARYISRMRADSSLYGESFYESGLIDSWIDFCSSEIEPAATNWYYPLLGYISYNESSRDKAKTDLGKTLEILEKELNTNKDTKTFLINDNITLADITIVSALIYPFKFVATSEYRDQYPTVMNWFTTCISQKEFKAIVGSVILCEREIIPIDNNDSNSNSNSIGSSTSNENDIAAIQNKMMDLAVQTPPPAP